MADDRLRLLATRAAQGRLFQRARKVRLSEANPAGRLRLDGLLRYAQDVSDDDTTDAGLATEPSWVARRTVADVIVPAVLGEELTFTTFCGGLGRRWAERRHTIVGSISALYEVSTLWICVDPVLGRPEPLTEQFVALYGAAAAGRTVGARLTLPKTPAANGGGGEGASNGRRHDGGGVRRFQWPLRVADFDVYDHVNNAAYGAVVEESLHHHGDQPAPFRWTIEYRTGITPQPEVTVVEGDQQDQRLFWWMLDGGTAAAVASLQPLPAGFYDAGCSSASAPLSSTAPLNTEPR